MGVLDDAIREHLELMRRRGADPSKVASVKRSALGAGDYPYAEAPSTPAPDATSLATYAKSMEESASTPTPKSWFNDPQEEGSVFADRTAEAPAEGLRSEKLADGDNAQEEALSSVQETQQLNNAQAVQAEGVGLLDQTPDFLEETPEHERRWFEQESPSSFDFGD